MMQSHLLGNSIYFIVCKQGVSLFTDARFYGYGLTCQQIEPTSREISSDKLYYTIFKVNIMVSLGLVSVPHLSIISLITEVALRERLSVQTAVLINLIQL